MTVDTKTINSVKITVPSVACIEPEDFPVENYKFASFDYAYNKTTPYVRSILDQVPIAGTRKRILVDIKVHDLKKGRTPALPHWHFDGRKEPGDESDCEINHLFVTPGSLTEFVKNEMIFYSSLGDSHQQLIGEKIQPYTIYTYDNHLHRATPATQDCKRLLVRVTETNVIRPRNQPFKVTYT